MTTLSYTITSIETNMSFYNTISEGIKDAMRSRDKERLNALRDIKSKLLLEATKTGANAENIDDVTAFAILNKLFKQRNESAEIYQEQTLSLDLSSLEKQLKYIFCSKFVTFLKFIFIEQYHCFDKF